MGIVLFARIGLWLIMVYIPEKVESTPHQATYILYCVSLPSPPPLLLSEMYLR